MVALITFDNLVIKKQRCLKKKYREMKVADKTKQSLENILSNSKDKTTSFEKHRQGDHIK